MTGCEDCSIYLWDIRAPRNINAFIGHNDYINGIAMSSAFTMLTCSDDCTLREWDLRTSSAFSIRKSQSPLKSLVVKGNFVITAGETMGIWTLEGFKMINSTGSIKSLHYCCEKDIVFAAGWDGLITAWSFNSKFA